MKILETQSATLSNYEVLQHLTSQAARRNPSTSSGGGSGSTAPTTMKSPNFETVVKELTDYLSPSPSSSPSPSATTTTTPHTTSSTPALPPYTPPHYTPTTIPTLLTRLQVFNLTKAELLMILNLRPLGMGLLDCVVEECDFRFSAGEQEEILGVVRGEGEGEGGGEKEGGGG